MIFYTSNILCQFWDSNLGNNCRCTKYLYNTGTYLKLSTFLHKNKHKRLLFWIFFYQMCCKFSLNGKLVVPYIKDVYKKFQVK